MMLCSLATLHELGIPTKQAEDPCLLHERPGVGDGAQRERAHRAARHTSTAGQGAGAVSMWRTHAQPGKLASAPAAAWPAREGGCAVEPGGEVRAGDVAAARLCDALAGEALACRDAGV